MKAVTRHECTDDTNPLYETVTHDCSWYDCEVALNGVLLHDVDVLDRLTGNRIETLKVGKRVPEMPEPTEEEKRLANVMDASIWWQDHRARFPGEYKDTRPFTARTVA